MSKIINTHGKGVYSYANPYIFRFNVSNNYNRKNIFKVVNNYKYSGVLNFKRPYGVRGLSYGGYYPSMFDYTFDNVDSDELSIFDIFPINISSTKIMV